MSDFGKIMLIVGTVIGSGFASGKEISVFFSRFGLWSYLFIPLVFLLFFGVFYWVLVYGREGVKKLYSSKFFLILFVIVSLVFTSSMFAGTTATMKFNNSKINLLLITILLLICIIVSQKGIGFLANINTYLIPFVIVVLICCLIKNTGTQQVFFNGNILSGALFSLLYVVMNVSTSCLVLAEIGERLSKKKCFKISFFSALILAILLLFINFVLLGNEGCLSLSMPLLEISHGNVRIMMRVVIFLGCLTTLFSLIFTVSEILKRMGLKAVYIVLISVIFPFSTSFLGFGNIVSILYPIVSVLGIFMLIQIIPLSKIKNDFLARRKIKSKKKINL